VNNLKSFLFFVGNIEIYSLLLDKLMVVLKGWRKSWYHYCARSSVVGFFTDLYLAVGK